MVHLLISQHQHIALRLVRVEFTVLRIVYKEELEEIRSLELHLQQLIMNQLICVPLVVEEEVLFLHPIILDKGVVLVEVVVVKPQAPLEHHHQDLVQQDLHIHYHMELLLDMVVTVVLELLEVLTTVMVVAVAVLLKMDYLNLTEADTLAVVVMEENLLSEETPTTSQVVAVEDVGTPTQIQEMVALLAPVVVVPVDPMVLVKKLARLIQLLLVAVVTG